MNQQKTSKPEQGVPLAQTNRQLWPSMKFTPAARSEPRGVSPRRRTDQPLSVIADYVTFPESPPPAHILPLPDLPEMEIPSIPQTPKRAGRGRPRVLTPLKREAILRALSQGKSRNQAAKGAQVCPATIRLEIKRDVTFALDVQVAEEEGQEFKRVFERLFVPGRVRLETEPVISTPEFERDKEFLVGRGLSRDWVSRMRLIREDEIEALARYDETRYQMAAKKGLRHDVEKALNFMAGEEIVETEFSPDGRQVERVKINRRLPPNETELTNRLASLEMALDLPSIDMEMLIAEMESRPWQCSRCRKKPQNLKKPADPKKQKPPGGTGGEERGTTSSTVQSEGTFDSAGSGSVLPASSIRRRRERRAGLAEVHSFVNVSKTSGDS